MRRVLIVTLLITVSTGCGRAGGPVPSGPASAATSAPAPSAAHLTLSGALTAELTAVVAEGPCGAQPSGYATDLRFQLAGRPHSLTVTLPDYRGPGSYTAPPGRVALHSVGFGTGDPVFFSGVAGTVTVNPGGVSGAVNEDLQGDAGRVHVSGTWTCATA